MEHNSQTPFTTEKLHGYDIIIMDEFATMELSMISKPNSPPMTHPNDPASESWPLFEDTNDNCEGCEICENHDDDCICDHCDVWIIRPSTTPHSSSKAQLREEIQHQEEKARYHDETVRARIAQWQKKARELDHAWPAVRDCGHGLRQLRESFGDAEETDDVFTENVSGYDEELNKYRYHFENVSWEVNHQSDLTWTSSGHNQVILHGTLPWYCELNNITVGGW